MELHTNFGRRKSTVEASNIQIYIVQHCKCLCKIQWSLRKYGKKINQPLKRHISFRATEFLNSLSSTTSANVVRWVQATKCKILNAHLHYSHDFGYVELQHILNPILQCYNWTRTAAAWTLQFELHNAVLKPLKTNFSTSKANFPSGFLTYE